MKKNNFYYFKKTLLLIIPITVFVIIRDLFEVESFNFLEILKLIAKGVVVGIFTGISLGIINIFAKIETFMKKKKI
jgi:Mg/Co/Ni transporter MgtE|tara:strand:- start:169 stop:396 length:228 start_codon:yes stop_codon:yes gene_type:complete